MRNVAEMMDLATYFLNAYFYEKKAFSLTGNLIDFRLEFQEVEEGPEGSMVIVFDLPWNVDATRPTKEILALANQSEQALLATYPEFEQLAITYKFVNE